MASTEGHLTLHFLRSDALASNPDQLVSSHLVVLCHKYARLLGVDLGKKTGISARVMLPAPAVAQSPARSSLRQLEFHRRSAG